MMNPCERTDSLLSAFIEEETSPAEHRFVDGHLAVCSRCRREHRALERLLRQLDLAPKVTVSDGFTERVLDEALGKAPAGLEEPVIPIRRSAGRYVLPGSMLAAAAALVLYFGSLDTRVSVPAEPQAGPTASVVPANSVGDEAGAPGQVPESRSLSDENPRLLAVETEEPALGVGMASEEYVLEDWTLNQPTGGGAPVLTRVSGAGSGDRVVVTY